MAVPTRSELDAMIRERLAADASFRDALLADPRAAVGELLGMDVPEFVRVTVHEESLTDVHLVIPKVVDEAVADEDLEFVSGGVCWTNTCGSSCAI